MKESLRSGFSFGITSGIITTLGLIVGLSTGTRSELAVLGGIISIALADGLSESMGMHVSKKSEKKNKAYVWESTFALLLAKFMVTMTFAIPVILFDLQKAVMIDIAWGLLLLSFLSHFVSVHKSRKRIRDVLEHLLIALIIIVAAYYTGMWVHAAFS